MSDDAPTLEEVHYRLLLILTTLYDEGVEAGSDDQVIRPWELASRSPGLGYVEREQACEVLLAGGYLWDLRGWQQSSERVERVFLIDRGQAASALIKAGYDVAPGAGTPLLGPRSRMSSLSG